MYRASKRLAAGIAAVVALLGGAARPAGATTTTTMKTTTTTTTTSTSTTTTSTTLAPHPFSAATASCIRQARAELKACRLAGTGSCLTPYLAAYPNCFPPKTGVTCATKCTGTFSKCLGAVPTTKKTCRAACVTSRKADVKACRRIAAGDTIWAGGDASCLTTAQSNYALCRIVCTEAAADCRTAFTFCIANCPNL